MGKVDLMHMGDFDSFFDYLYNETEHGEYTRLITDTVQELSGWACFKEEKRLSYPLMTSILPFKLCSNMIRKMQ